MVDVKKFKSILEENSISYPWETRYQYGNEAFSPYNIFGFFMYLHAVESSEKTDNKIKHIKLLRNMTRVQNYDGESSVMSLKQSKEVYESLYGVFIEEGRLNEIGFILRDEIQGCFTENIYKIVAKMVLLNKNNDISKVVMSANI